MKLQNFQIILLSIVLHKCATATASADGDMLVRAYMENYFQPFINKVKATFGSDESRIVQFYKQPQKLNDPAFKQIFECGAERTTIVGRMLSNKAICPCRCMCESSCSYVTVGMRSDCVQVADQQIASLKSGFEKMNRIFGNTNHEKLKRIFEILKKFEYVESLSLEDALYEIFYKFQNFSVDLAIKDLKLVCLTSSELKDDHSHIKFTIDSMFGIHLFKKAKLQQKAEKQHDLATPDNLTSSTSKCDAEYNPKYQDLDENEKRMLFEAFKGFSVLEALDELEMVMLFPNDEEYDVINQRDLIDLAVDDLYFALIAYLIPYDLIPELQRDDWSEPTTSDSNGSTTSDSNGSNPDN